MQTTKKVFFVSHTHWDREWYLPKEKFRYMLIQLIDGLLEILDKDEGDFKFMLDGQTIAIEDYLKFRPENEQKLKKYVEEGKILIGPWYILPDEILISGESHIRNYIFGDATCKRLGAKMNLGYLPDAFGHPSQMPQIIKGLGMDEIIFWRGLGPEVSKTEFKWIAPDGSDILGVNMPYGYGLGACLPEDRKHFKKRIKDTIDMMSRLTDMDSILIMNGVDHVAPQKFLPQYIEEYKDAFQGYKLLYSNLPEYIGSIREQKDKINNLQTYSGELRSPQRAYLLGGTLSTRMYIKKANYETEQMVEKWVEPVSTMAMIEGKKYPYGEIQVLWKKVLSNLPHDSICGCSIDEVHDEMMMRYQNIGQLSESILDDSFNYVADRVPDKKEYDGAVVIFNTLGHSRTDIVNAVVDVNEQLIRKVNFDNGVLTDYPYDKEKQLPDGIRIYNTEGKEIKAVINLAEKVTKMKLSPNTQPEMYEVQRLHISFISDGVPSVGYSTYYYNLTYGNKTEEQCKKDTTARIENEYFRIEPDKDGTISIYDKQQDKLYNGCNKLLDDGDAGDEYTYSPPCNDASFSVEGSSLSYSVVEKNDVKQSLMVTGILNLPTCMNSDRKSRSADRVECRLKSVVTIYTGIKRIDIKTEFENNAEDHRVRAFFPTDLVSDYAYTEGIFNVDERKLIDNLNLDDYKDWVEMPGNIHPQKSFVDVNDGEKGLMIANRGIPECEIIKEGGKNIIALTLLRCVGWLSRGDLLYRKGNGGWTIPTPGAQCKGKYIFEYSVIPHKNNWLKSLSFTCAHDFNTPLKAVQKFNTKEDKICPEDTLVMIDSPEIVISALKKSERGDAVVLRMYNISGLAINTKIKLNFKFKSVQYGDLIENGIKNIEAGADGLLDITFGPHKIVTLVITR